MISRTVTALRPGASPAPAVPVLHETPASRQERFFETPALRALLGQLLRDLPQAGEVMFVRGPRGSGKSALMRRFLQLAPGEWEITALQARVPVGEAHLVAQLGQAWFPDQALDSAELLRNLLSLARGSTLPVLVVDDAQRLSPFALRWLLLAKQAVNDRGGRLGVLLFVDETIAERLEIPSLVETGPGTLRIFDLPPFSLEETADYLRHCLIQNPPLDGENGSSGGRPGNGDGRTAEFPLSEKRLRLLHRASGGRPGTIERLFVAGIQGRLRGFHLPRGDWGRHKAAVFSGAALAGLLLVAALVFYFPGSGAPPQRVVAAPDLLTDDMQDAPRVIPGSIPESVAEIGPVDESAADRGVGPATASLQASNPTSSSASAVEKGPVTTTRSAVPPPRTKPARTTPAPVPAAGPALAQKTPAPRSGDPVVRDSSWILEQDARRFTIQLTSWADEKRAIKYIKDHRLYDDAAYVHTRSKGKDWYLVVYRTYPSVGKARQAIKELPPPLKKYGPWVRNISSLQALAVVD